MITLFSSKSCLEDTIYVTLSTINLEILFFLGNIFSAIFKFFFQILVVF